MADTSVQDGLIALQERREALALAKAAADEATAKLHEAQKALEKAVEALTALVESGKSTGDNLFDNVLKCRMFSDEALARYRALEARLRGCAGQLILVHSKHSVNTAPQVRYAHGGAKRSHIMSPNSFDRWVELQHFCCGVLAGEELLLEQPPRGFLNCKTFFLPTGGKHVVEEDSNIEARALGRLIMVKENLPLPREAPAAGQPRYVSGFPMLHHAEKRITEAEELVVGDEAVCEWLKAHRTLEAVPAVALALDKIDLVPPDLRP